jgi:hypothetical protein
MQKHIQRQRRCGIVIKIIVPKKDGKRKSVKLSHPT